MTRDRWRQKLISEWCSIEVLGGGTIWVLLPAAKYLEPELTGSRGMEAAAKPAENGGRKF